MIFLDSRFGEELADKNASFSKDNYSIVRIDKSCLAGAIVSDKRFPPTSPALLKKHIESGSMFVALLDKYSIEEGAIANLLELKIRNISAVFLGTPVHVNGYVKIDNFLELPEREYMIEKCKLTAVGINVFECPVYCLDVFLEEMEQYLLSDKPLEVYPSYIKYRIIDDWRKMVAGMPLIGGERADVLYKKYGDRPVIDVLRYLTDKDKNTEGFGRVICDRLRDWIGIPDEFNIGLVWKGDE